MQWARSEARSSREAAPPRPRTTALVALAPPKSAKKLARARGSQRQGQTVKASGGAGDRSVRRRRDGCRDSDPRINRLRLFTAFRVVGSFDDRCWLSRILGAGFRMLRPTLWRGAEMCAESPEP